MAEERSESCAAEGVILSNIMRSPESGQMEASSLTPQVDNDPHLIELWLHGRPKNTRRAYRREVTRFIDHVQKPLRTVRLADLQEFSDSLRESLKQSSANRALTAIKSLVGFGFRLGYFPFDVGRAMKLAACRDELAERILAETEVLRIISLEPNPRNLSLIHI